MIWPQCQREGALERFFDGESLVESLVVRSFTALSRMLSHHATIYMSLSEYSQF